MPLHKGWIFLLCLKSVFHSLLAPYVRCLLPPLPRGWTRVSGGVGSRRWVASGSSSWRRYNLLQFSAQQKSSRTSTLCSEGGGDKSGLSIWELLAKTTFFWRVGGALEAHPRWCRQGPSPKRWERRPVCLRWAVLTPRSTRSSLSMSTGKNPRANVRAAKRSSRGIFWLPPR